jgi:hypothetical protein
MCHVRSGISEKQDFRIQCFIVQVSTGFIARVYTCQSAVLINTLSANNQKQKKGCCQHKIMINLYEHQNEKNKDS